MGSVDNQCGFLKRAQFIEQSRNLFKMAYIIYSSVVFSVLTVFYWLFLKHETFFHWNRKVLLGSIFLAILIPLIPIPQFFFSVKEAALEQAKAEIDRVFAQKSGTIEEGASPKIDLSDQEVKPIVLEKPDLKLSKVINFKAWFYGFGLMILLIRFVVQLFAVTRQIRNASISKGKRYHLASVQKDIAPYSFGKFIVLNPDKYKEQEFLQILQHEKVHIHQWHTIDLILAELFTAFQWFNPFAWLHRRLIMQNLEYQADAAVLSSGENKKEYQYHLLKIAVPNYPLSITTNYNQSLIKKRITMMNRKKSSLSSIVKYLLLLPVCFILLTAFKATPLKLKTFKIETHNFNAPNGLDRMYVFISDQATQPDLRRLQSDLDEIGFRLQFEKLIYQKDRIVEASASLMDASEMGGISEFSGDKAGQFLFFSREWDLGGLGSGYDELMIQRMQEEGMKIKIFRGWHNLG